MRVCVVALLLIALVASIHAKPEVVIDLALGTTTSGKLLSAEDGVVFRTTVADHEPPQGTSFLEFDTGTTDLGAEVCTYITWNRVPSKRFYDTAKCTNGTALRTVIEVPSRLFAAGDWYALVTADRAATYVITAFNNSGSPTPPTPTPGPPPPATCPTTTSHSVLDGPYRYRGYCYYLGVWGKTCDQVCGDIGGSNLFEFAKLTLASVPGDGRNSHTCHDEHQPIVHFYKNGDKGSFRNGPGTTNNYATLGIGDKNGYYWCSCSSCTTRGAGSAVGDFLKPWHKESRSNACACFSV